jgi:outer membrane protein TolC
MRISTSRCLATVLGAFAFAVPYATAQVSLTTAVDLALRNDPKVKMAQADRDRALAALAEVHDAIVPNITTDGGVGRSAGVPLGLPVVFSISAQSLAFNFSQQDYIRAAHAGVAAADLELREVRDTTAQDVIDTYVSLDVAAQRQAAIAQASGFAARVTQIVQDRLDAGMDPHIELTRAKLNASRLREQQLQTEDEIASLSAHLARLTGIGGTHVETVHDSIPAFSPVIISEAGNGDSYSVQAAFANAKAKWDIAHGDSRYRWRPQMAFSAGYSRISTAFTNYAQYYKGFNTDLNGNQRNSFNSLNIGVQISVPILDLVHQAKARGSAAEAARARFQAEDARAQLFEGRIKLQHAAAELSAHAETASLDRDYAQDQLDALVIQLQANQANPNGAQLTPKDEQNARLQERQRYLDFLAADLELRQTEIKLLKENGQLGDWLHDAIGAPGAKPPASGRGPVLPAAPPAPR